MERIKEGDTFYVLGRSPKDVERILIRIKNGSIKGTNILIDSEKAARKKWNSLPPVYKAKLRIFTIVWSKGK